jgi:hypothetical protein
MTQTEYCSQCCMDELSRNIGYVLECEPGLCKNPKTGERNCTCDEECCC